MIAASDAAHERGKGSGGFLFSDAFFCRRGAVVEIDAKVGRGRGLGIRAPQEEKQESCQRSTLHAVLRS